MKTALRSNRLVGLVLVVFAVLAALLWRSARQLDTTRDHSTFRKNGSGCAALAELLRTVEPRLEVRDLTRPLTDLSAVHGLLVVLDPTEPFSDREIAELVRWVGAGGVLLVGVEGLWDDVAAARAGTSPPYVKLVGALGVATPQTTQAMTVAQPAPRSPLGPGVKEVAIATHYEVVAWAGRSQAGDWAADELHPGAVACLVPHGPGDLTPHLVANGHTIVASFHHGRGQAFVSSDVQMLANSMLGRSDNVALVANLFWRTAPGGRVYFDEYHHGFGPRRGTASPVDPRPLQKAVLVLLAGVVIFLVGQAVRFGAPVAVFDPKRRTTREYVEGLADLWQRAEAHAFALRQIATASRQRLAAAVGLRPAASAETLAATLAARRGISADAVSSLLADLERAQASPGVTEKEVVRLVQRMTDLEARVLSPGRASRRSEQGSAGT